MVSKRKIAEVVLNMVNGGVINKDSKITIRQAMEAVGEARNKVISQTLYQNYTVHGMWDIPFELLKEFTVKSNEDKGFWSVNLPARVLPLHNGMGVYHVSQEGFEENDFIPKINGAISMFSDMESDSVEGQNWFIPRENYLQLGGQCKSINVFMRLIVASDDLSDREDFRITGDMESDIIEMSFQKLAIQAQVPADYIPNNINDKR